MANSLCLEGWFMGRACFNVLWELGRLVEASLFTALIERCTSDHEGFA